MKQDEKLASINAHKFRKLGRKTCWFPGGVVLKRWTEEIYPTISTIINDAGNYERFSANIARRSHDLAGCTWWAKVDSG